MSLEPAPFTFATAFDRLNPAERDFVAGFVATVAEQAKRADCDLVTVLERITASGAVFDWRTAEFLALERVRYAVRERCDQLDAQNRLSHDRLRRELSYIAFANIKECFKPDPFNPGDLILDISAIPDRVWPAIAEVKIEESANGGAKKTTIKMHSKMDAIKYAGSHIGFDDPANAYRQKEKSRDNVAQTSIPDFTQNIEVTALQDAYLRMLEAGE